MSERAVETDIWGQSQEEELGPSATEQMESVEAEIGPFLVIHHHSGNLDADERCNNVPKIQEDKTPAGDGTRQHTDSHLGYGVRTVWRKWICFWLRRKYTSKTFANPQSKSNQPAAGGGLWQSLSCRHLLLLLRSRHPHIAVADQLHMCRSAVDSPQPGYKSVSVVNGCFLDDGELVASWHKVCGDPCSDASATDFLTISSLMEEEGSKKQTSLICFSRFALRWGFIVGSNGKKTQRNSWLRRREVKVFIDLHRPIM